MRGWLQKDSRATLCRAARRTRCTVVVFQARQLNIGFVFFIQKTRRGRQKYDFGRDYV